MREAIMNFPKFLYLEIKWGEERKDGTTEAFFSIEPPYNTKAEMITALAL